MAERLPSLLFALLFAQGCGDGITSPATRYAFSFEQGMEGWAATAADTGTPGGAYAPWSIAPSAEFVHEGRYALRFYMDNNTDAAKIWIVRPFAVAPGRSYDIDVSYAFGSDEWADIINPFVLLTGVFRTAPDDGTSLVAGSVPDDTRNGADSDVGYVWARKTVRVSVSGGATDRLYVVVGIWGTWEVARTYYLDDLEVELTPR